jgi:hypothetical protein
MAAVKGSKQYQMRVVPYRPWLRLVWIVCMVLGLVAAAVLGYYLGTLRGSVQQFPQAKLDGLSEQLERKAAEAASLQQEVANLRLGAEVDRKANDDVRNEVLQLKDTIAEQQETISYYKALISPGSNNKGLTFGAVNIVPSGGGRGYDFKIVVQQLGTDTQYLSGYLTVAVVGRLAGSVVSLPLQKLSDDIKSEKITLKFRYFQTISGHLTLPDGFVPERVDLLVQSTGNGAAKIEKRVGWQAQEN